MTIVLDADVLIGALDATDRHHARARRVFTDWHRQSETLDVSVLNLSEVLVAPAPEAGRLRRARAAIAALGLAIHRPTEAILGRLVRPEGRSRRPCRANRPHRPRGQGRADMTSTRSLMRSGIAVWCADVPV